MSRTKAENREFELKFNVTGKQMRQLRGKRILKDLAASPREHAILRGIYFDTPDQVLRRRNTSLRVREKAGEWVQTAKIGRGVVAGLSSPIEIECRVEGPAICVDTLKQAGLPKDTAKLLDRSILAPVFETVISRITHNIEMRCGATIEVAFDKGAVSAGKLTHRFHEVELELESGAPSSLFAFAQRLTRGETVRFSGWSKAERGYRLLSGEPDVPPLPEMYAAPIIMQTSTAKGAFVLQLQACTRQIEHNWKVVLDCRNIEGPHQLRIGLRRLRSLLDAYEPIADRDAFRSLDRAARKLASIVGRLRDADVLINDIFVVGASRNNAGFVQLRERLVAERRIIRKKVRVELAGDKMMGLLLKLGAFSQSPEELFPAKGAANRPILEVASAALEKSWNATAKQGRSFDKMNVRKRHAMRKSLKNLRYQVDAFASLYPRRQVKPFRKKLKILQDVFGYMNDVAMAESLTRSLSTGNREIHLSAGFVLGWHTARSEQRWSQVRRRWKDLKQTRKFWTD